MQFTWLWFCQLRLADLLEVLSKHLPVHHFQDFLHKIEVPGLTGEWLVFKYCMIVKDGLQRASPVKIIAHPFPPIKLINWNETWSHWHSWPFESSFCSSKSFCNSHRTVRQRHREGDWSPSLSSQSCNTLYKAVPPSRKWKYSPHHSLITYADLQTESLQGWTLPPHSPPHRGVSACNH